MSSVDCIAHTEPSAGVAAERFGSEWLRNTCLQKRKIEENQERRKLFRMSFSRNSSIVSLQSSISTGEDSVIHGSGDDSSTDSELSVDDDSRNFTITLADKGPVPIPRVSSYGLSLDEFLDVILRERGYETDRMPAPYVCKPTEKQVVDYNMALVSAVRESDTRTISEMLGRGSHANACNKVSSG